MVERSPGMHRKNAAETRFYSPKLLHEELCYLLGEAGVYLLRHHFYYIR